MRNVEMTNESERLQILEMIEKGIISAEEGVRLINSLQPEPEAYEAPSMSATSSASSASSSSSSASGGSSPAPEVTVEEPSSATADSQASTNFENETRKWRGWWWI